VQGPGLFIGVELVEDRETEVFEAALAQVSAMPAEMREMIRQRMMAEAVPG